MALTRVQGKEKEPTLSALPFYNAEIDAEPAREHKSHWQPKQEKFQHTTVSSSSPPEVPVGFKIPGNIVELQTAWSSETACCSWSSQRICSGPGPLYSLGWPTGEA